MQSFSWMKKSCKKTKNIKPSVFQEDDNDVADSSVDFFHATVTRKILPPEDSVSKAKRLTDEGIILAENERWWEAIGRWNMAVSLSSDDYRIHDMLAQAYMQVGEVYAALRSSSKATRIAPCWWSGHQTHGRALLGLGEVAMAVKAFSRAVHLQPDQKELWKDDLAWAVDLLRKHQTLEKAAKERKELERKREEEEKRSCEFILEEISDEHNLSVDDVCVKKESDDAKLPASETGKTMLPAITCTSRKRKQGTDLPQDVDPRFDKVTALYDQSGRVKEADRMKMVPGKMVCLRR